MPTQPDPDLGRRMGLQMQRLRARLGQTQKEAATRVGMHTNQWAKYERGEQVMPLRYVQAIESAFAFSFELDAPKPTKPTVDHPPEYYKGMLDTARQLMALGQHISEEAMDNLSAAATTPSADRLAAVAGAVAVRKAQAQKKRHRTG